MTMFWPMFTSTFLKNIKNVIFLPKYSFFQNSTPACSCVDCEASCPSPPPAPSKPEPFKIAGHDGYSVMMIIIFVVGSAMFIFAVVICSSKDKLGKPN